MHVHVQAQVHVRTTKHWPERVIFMLILAGLGLSGAMRRGQTQTSRWSLVTRDFGRALTIFLAAALGGLKRGESRRDKKARLQAPSSAELVHPWVMLKRDYLYCMWLARWEVNLASYSSGGSTKVNALDGLDLMLCFFTSTSGPTIDIHLMETGETYV